MARDYKRLWLKREGIWVPRWLAWALGALFLLWVGWKIFAPESWLIQRLDSPDGTKSARLLRSHYIKDYFVVYVKDGLFWRTAYYSPPITNDYRVDLGERLVWSPDSKRIFLRLRGRYVWGYDLERDTGLDRLPGPSDGAQQSERAEP